MATTAQIANTAVQILVWVRLVDGSEKERFVVLVVGKHDGVTS